jgi:hypothetical protein
VSGDIVASQHEEEVEDGTGRVRYYFDRIDVSNPAEPRLLPEVNIPGSVVHFDADKNRIVTIDSPLSEKSTKTPEDCYDNNSNAIYDYVAERCRIYRRRPNVLDLEGDIAVLKDSRELDQEAWAGSIAISENRIFYQVSVWDETAPNAPPKQSVHVLSYNARGDIQTVGEVALENAAGWWGQLVARGGRASTRAGLTGSDLWMSTRAQMGDEFSAPVELSELNTIDRESSPALDPSGLSLYFVSNRAGSALDDVWVATRPDLTSEFGAPSLVVEVSSSASDIDVFLSLDGRELLMSSARAGTREIWRALRDCRTQPEQVSFEDGADDGGWLG